MHSFVECNEDVYCDSDVHYDLILRLVIHAQMRSMLRLKHQTPQRL